MAVAALVFACRSSVDEPQQAKRLPSSEQERDPPESGNPVQSGTAAERPPDLPHLVELVEAELVWYEAGPDVGPHGFQSFLGIEGTTNHDVFDVAAIIFSCDSDLDNHALEAVVLIVRVNAGQWEPLRLSDVAPTRATVDFGPGTQRQSFDSQVRKDAQGVLFRNGGDLLEAAKRHDRLNVRVPLPEAEPEDRDFVVASFDLQDAFDTPVQPNLDFCGEY